jgi:hypothetical protein
MQSDENIEKTTAEVWGECARLEVHPPELAKAGRSCFVKRIDVRGLLVSPHLPGPLLTAVIQYFQDLDESGIDTVAGSLSKLPVEQAAKMPDVVNAVLIHSLDGPFGVLDNPDPKKNQVDVRRMPDADRMFLFTGAMNDWPELPVQTKGGEVALDDLKEFPVIGQGDADTSGGEGVQGQGV